MKAKDSDLEMLIVEFGNSEFQCGLLRAADIEDYREVFIERNVAKRKLIEYLESEK